jgi:hypothetical protein
MPITNEQCPLVSFPISVDESKKVVGKHQTNPIEKLDVAKAIGYIDLHGTSYEHIAALIGYGLLEKVNGKKLRVSPDALDIINPSSHDDIKRAKAIHKAAFTPSVFKRLNTLYEGKLPEEAQLVSDLTSLGLHHNKIGSATKAYLETVKFANEAPLEDWKPITQSKSDEFLGRSSSTQSTSFSKQIEESELGWWRLTTGCEGQIRFRGQVTQEALQKLIAHIEISMDAYPKQDHNQR